MAHQHEQTDAHAVKSSDDLRSKFAHIQGWGADLDPADRPAYPMERTPPRLDNVHWTQPEQQPVRQKIYRSTERPGITPVFGTSTPPKWFSGKIRDIAYRYSENDLRRWFLLLFADRINVAEGIGDDLRKGHVPDVLGEMGIKSEWKYNRAGLLRKAAVAGAVAGLAYYWLKGRRSY
jgi:hypothetical protein